MFGWLSLLSLTDWRSLSCSSCPVLLLMVPGYAIIVQRSMVGLAAALETHIRPPRSAVWSRVETHVRRVVLQLQG